MTTYYSAVIECDRCGKSFKQAKRTVGAKELLREAKLAGWHRNTKSLFTDLCRDCVIDGYPLLISDRGEQ